MNDTWLKIKFWTKVTITAIVTLYIAVFIAKNSERSAQFWYWFYKDYQIPILVLAACSFLAGALSVILIRTTYRTVRQLRELRTHSRTEKLEREMADMKAKAAMLQTRSPTTDPIPPSDKPL
jgi:uncharacterized integral membrane protein